METRCLEGKTALVSGGSRGIGKAIALRLTQMGADVALLYAGNARAAEETVKEIEALGVRARAYQCDVADFAACEAAVKAVQDHFGPVYVLVNNAGITNDKLALQMQAADFADVIATNLNGAFHLIRHCYSGFMRQRGGRIINISSVAGIMGNAGQANYASAKAGLIGLTKSIAKELAARGVTCNAIAPGLIETDMMHAIPQAAKDALIASIPAKRVGTAAEVAALAAYLASPLAGYLTGAVIPIDGGLSM